MKYFLIDWTMNWADEINIYSAEVMTEEELNSAKTKLNNFDPKKEICICFGSNEDDYYTVESIKEFLNEAKEITEVEYNSFMSMFDSGVFGEIDFSNILEDLENDYDYE